MHQDSRPPQVIPASPGTWWKPNTATLIAGKCDLGPYPIVAWNVTTDDWGRVRLLPLIPDGEAVVDPLEAWCNVDADEYGDIVHESDL